MLRLQTVNQHSSKVGVRRSDKGAASDRIALGIVDLLRQTGVVLHPLTVMAGVKLLCNATGWQWCWQRRRVNRALDRLVQSERILEPRDGQIEAKGYLLEVDSYLSLLSQSMPGQLPLQLQISSWWGIALAADERKAYGAALESVCKLIERPTGAEFDALVRWLQGNVLYKLTRYQEAIAAFDAAIAIKPDYHEAFSNKACIYALSLQLNNALTFLQKAIALDGTNKYIEMAKTDSDFDAIRDRPEFQALIAQYEETQHSEARSLEP